MKTLRVFNVQRMSLHDGPGMRTTIFLKGCNLRCRWCHNPESQRFEKEILWEERECLGCRECVGICLARQEDIGLPDRELCIGCGRCIETCMPGALELAGRDIPTDDLVEDVLRDWKLFKLSGGGVTFSGGEPMLQAEAVAEAAERLNASGVSVIIDTAGDVPWSAFERVLPFTDAFLIDLKLMNTEKHQLFTGTDNHRILENLAAVSTLKKVVVRIPLINGVNTDEAEQMGMFLSNNCRIHEVELLRYHSVGKEKYKRLGRAFEAFSAPDDDRMSAFGDVLKRYGLTVNINI